MTHRLSLALILIGVISLLVYVISASNQQGDYKLLLIGACISLLGVLLRRRAIRSRASQSQRFRLLRRNQADEMDE
jgi:glucose-6-phosphate-specific signal transduction histidine kinase